MSSNPSKAAGGFKLNKSGIEQKHYFGNQEAAQDCSTNSFASPMSFKERNLSPSPGMFKMRPGKGPLGTVKSFVNVLCSQSKDYKNNTIKPLDTILSMNQSKE